MAEKKKRNISFPRFAEYNCAFKYITEQALDARYVMPPVLTKRTMELGAKYSPDFVCTPISTSLSFGGERCEFDWGYPLTPEEAAELAEKKKALGSSCMKDFNFHTAHLKHTLSRTLTKLLGAEGERAVSLALSDYTDTFGLEYLDILDTIDPSEF